MRVNGDLRNEKITYKVREHSLAKVPAILVVGKREAAERSVNLRRLGSQQQQSLALDEALRALAEEAVPPDLRRPLPEEEGLPTADVVLDSHHGVIERTLA